MEITLETVVFYLLAIFITIFSVKTVTTNRIVHSATYLLFVLFGTAGIYFLLGYTFLGSVQIMVYAGGIVVLYVFSIFLTSGKSDRVEELKRSKFLAATLATIAGRKAATPVMLGDTREAVFSPKTQLEFLQVSIPELHI